MLLKQREATSGRAPEHYDSGIRPAGWRGRRIFSKGEMQPARVHSSFTQKQQENSSKSWKSTYVSCKRLQTGSPASLSIKVRRWKALGKERASLRGQQWAKWIRGNKITRDKADFYVQTRKQWTPGFGQRDASEFFLIWISLQILHF